MNSEHKTSSPEETIELGRSLADQYGYGKVFALEAELGGGKTVLAKGIASGLGVEDTDTVKSPTFTLVNRYTGTEGFIFHVDLYRLTTPEEAEAIGIEEMLESGSTVIIEWAERISGLLDKRQTVYVRIETESETERSFRITE